MSSVKDFLKRKDIVITPQRYLIEALGAMAQGLFASLLIGTISNDADGGAADDAQAQDAEQRLRVDAALLLLDPRWKTYTRLPSG